MYRLYGRWGSVWKEYALLKSRTGEYAAQVREGIARANADNKEIRRNAAIVMQDFVLEQYYYERADGKLVLRALRHFDEVGMSNRVWENLQALLDDGAEAFALVKEGEDIANFKAGKFEVTVS